MTQRIKMRLFVVGVSIVTESLDVPLPNFADF
jgi:hypothetical protein